LSADFVTPTGKIYITTKTQQVTFYLKTYYIFIYIFLKTSKKKKSGELHTA